ncbi:hypothetical protein ACMG4P_20220 [Pseudovibrio denitrificans]|uniref:hypothetical protein n=1 Tax=Pseudovibrio denitrificans TaxID=258256 RepID=UPI0039BF6A0A
MSISNVGQNPLPSTDTYTRFSQSSENVFGTSVSEITAKQRSISSASVENARVAGPNFRGNVSYENFLELNGLNQSLGEEGLEGIAQRSKEAELKLNAELEEKYAEIEEQHAEGKRRYHENYEEDNRRIRQNIAERKREIAKWERELSGAHGRYKDFVQGIIDNNKTSIAEDEKRIRQNDIFSSHWP